MGSCQGLFTANTMAILTEAMGIEPPTLRHRPGGIGPQEAHCICIGGKDC